MVLSKIEAFYIQMFLGVTACYTITVVLISFLYVIIIIIHYLIDIELLVYIWPAKSLH